MTPFNLSCAAATLLVLPVSALAFDLGLPPIPVPINRAAPGPVGVPNPQGALDPLRPVIPQSHDNYGTVIGGSSSGPAVGGNNTGDAGSRGGDPPPNATEINPVIVSICYQMGNLTNNCLKQGIDAAAEKLAHYLWDKHKKNLWARIRNNTRDYIFRVTFPVAAEKTEEIRSLYQIEKKALDQVKVWLESDVSSLTPYEWRVERSRQVAEIMLEAEREARALQNWTPEPPKGSNLYKPGRAIAQATAASTNTTWEDDCKDNKRKNCKAYHPKYFFNFDTGRHFNR